MTRRLYNLGRRWDTYWRLRAATTIVNDIGFRESNGETCPQREHREAKEALAQAQEDYDRARKVKR